MLLELVADERLEGCQHFAFKEYKNANGDCILEGHANGSVSYQIAWARVGPRAPALLDGALPAHGAKTLNAT